MNINKKRLSNTYLYAYLGLFFVSHLFIYALCITVLYDIHKQEQKIIFYESEIQKHKKDLLLIQSNDFVKKYAEQTLNMKQLNLKEIKKIIIKKIGI